MRLCTHARARIHELIIEQTMKEIEIPNPT